MINTVTTSWVSIISRGVIFLVIWWLLTDGTVSSLWIGLPAVLIALLTSVVLLPPVHLVWYECLRFVPFFLVRSLIGGVDVAWRAVHPRMPIAPELIEYPIRLPAGLSQVFMANTVNLLPGTLSAALDKHILTVHVLDGRRDNLTELEVVEHYVARLFGLSLNAPLRGE